MGKNKAMSQNKVIIDFETRSTVNLTKCGMWAYAEHPTTDILCMGYRGTTEIEIFKYPLTNKSGIIIDYIHYWLDSGWIFEAHNAEFERAIWYHICHKRWGWPDIPLTKWRCIAAKAAALSLPRSLEKVAKALGLPQQKDMGGRALMLKMCKPRKPTKKEKIEWIEKIYSKNLPDGGFKDFTLGAKNWHLETAEKNMSVLWHEKPEDLERLYRYCKQDVEVEAVVSERLRELNIFEQTIWFLDQKINQRGVQIDTEVIKKAIKIRETYKGKLLSEFKGLTGLNSPQQVAETLSSLEFDGLKLKDLTKLSVENALKKELPGDIRRILEIRQTLSMSSIAKLDAMLRGTSEDGRAKSILMYHGGHTGRWAGKRIQPQNMPRSTLANVDYFIESIEREDIDTLTLLWDTDIYKSLSSCIRSFIVSRPGYDLICADFSAIEARVNAWLAGEQHVLDAFNNGLDPYKVAASDIYSKGYDDITKDERAAGKVADLALGYQGALRAYLKMSATYGVSLPEEQIEAIVKTWRGSHPRIVKFWYAMEAAAIAAVKSNYTQSWGRLTWGKKDDWLFCRLPSGRFLAYYQPRVVTKMMPWKKEKECLVYMGVNSMTKKWEEQTTYGGKLVENIVQAVARDILAEAIVRVEAHKYPVVLHVHDEIVAEVPEGFGSLKEFEDLVAIKPVWVGDCPIDAAGWRGKRYRKE